MSSETDKTRRLDGADRAGRADKTDKAGRAGKADRADKAAGRPAGRTSSIARRIVLSLYLRRFASFLCFDVMLVIVFAGVFLWHCMAQLPESARDGMRLRNGDVRVEAPQTAQQNPILWLWECDLVLVDEAGEEHVFPLSEPLTYALPVGAFVLVAEVLSMFGAPDDTRLIRRKLRPLNELALAAEAIGSADPLAAGGGASKLASLEHAISEASVDAPSVSTGDKDLRSIEVALNGLLRRMQQAKLEQMRFVSDASHELRTPIAVIQGYVGMLDRWGKTDEAVLDESIEALKSESAHMQELVEQLLFLARGDSGRSTLEFERLDLEELAREVTGESRMIDAEHDYVLDVPAAGAGPAGDAGPAGYVKPTGDIGRDGEDAAGPWQVTGDRSMVKQSMRIILQNAARYSPAGSTVRLALVGDSADCGRAGGGGVDCGHADRGGAGRVGYVVQDEGMGMAEQDAAHIFERFYRSDAARDRRSGGTGLGLSIAKWIVDAHGGSIEVLSREGVGTRFTVWFPRTVAPHAGT